MPTPTPAQDLDRRPALVVIVGPTAAGKSTLALEVAVRLGGELINADATALYRYLDIGSAKPDAAALGRAPHHLLDVADPHETLTVVEYQRLAYGAIDDVLARGHLPILVGGSGLYVRAVVEGYSFPVLAPRQELRRELQEVARSRGAGELYRRLEDVDPRAAEQIHPNNVRRVVRALEVYYTTGTPISHFWDGRDVRYRPLQVGLRRPREVLYRRIDERVRNMVDRGLVDEVRGILERGVPASSPALLAIGYKELVAYLEGQVDLATAMAAMARATRKLARLQMTSWFRHDDPAITWFDAMEPGCPEAVVRHLRARLAE